MTQDCCYFVNCFRGDERKSAVAYYAVLNDGTGNLGQQPDDLVYLPGDDLAQWEGSGEVTFPDSGVTVTWTIFQDAQSPSKPPGANVGVAGNGSEVWTVYKSGGETLVVDNDGFICKKIYLAGPTFGN